MGLTLDDLRLITDPEQRAFLESQHPDRRKGKAVGAATTAKRRQPRAGEQNKTEARYDAHLAELKLLGRVEDYAFEPFKLRLAGRTWFRVDFAVWVGGRLVIVDVKGGPLEDDAAVKLKVCAEKYPRLPLFLVYYENRAWVYREVTRSGIGGWCAEPF